MHLSVSLFFSSAVIFYKFNKFSAILGLIYIIEQLLQAKNGGAISKSLSVEKAIWKSSLYIVMQRLWLCGGG